LSVASSTSQQSILKLYERWLRSGSIVLGGELVERGVLPMRGAGGVH